MVRNPPASAAGAGDAGLIFGSERASRVGNGKLLQYSFLEKSMGRGVGQATVCGGHKESDVAEAT